MRDIIDPLNPLEPSSGSGTGRPHSAGDAPPQIPIDEWPNIEDLAIEDGEPVENLFAEKQYRLLTEPLYASWRPEGHTFMVLANVGLFYEAKHPPLVPDVMLSLDVRRGRGRTRKENNSYFVWIMGKVPDVVIEFVSDRRGSEEDYKKDEYERIGIPYYVIFDPDNYLRNGVLRVFHLENGAYQATEAVWLPEVGLGLTMWEGSYEEEPECWLRWCDRDGNPIHTGRERAELETHQAEQQRQRAKQERRRAKEERQRAEEERQRAEEERQRAEEERQRAEEERQRAEEERQRSERLAAQLRALGIEPNP